MNFGKRKLPPPLSPSGAGPSDDTVKRKFRNLNEKKRRDQFNLLINELSTIVCTGDARKVDKTTVLEEAIKFLEFHKRSDCRAKYNVSYSWKPSFLSPNEFTHLMLEAMDCVTMSVTEDGKVSSVSENVESKLGLTQEILSTWSLNDLLADSALISKLVARMRESPNQLLKASSLLVTNPNAPLNDQPRYQAVEISCVPGMNTLRSADGNDVSEILLSSVIQSRVPCYSRQFYKQSQTSVTFKGKYSLEWKILHLEPKSSSVLGFQPFELMGISAYDYYHPQDIWKISLIHKKVLKAGCCQTPFYRMMTKSHDWVWLQTDFHISFNHWSGKKEHIEALHKLGTKEEVELSQQTNSFLEETSAADRIRTPSPANPYLQPTKIPISAEASSTRLLDAGISQAREGRFDRLPTDVAIDMAAFRSKPKDSDNLQDVLLQPQCLSPAQIKLHTQLQKKYLELKSNLVKQQSELDDLLTQLNMAARGGQPSSRLTSQPFNPPYSQIISSQVINAPGQQRSTYSAQDGVSIASNNLNYNSSIYGAANQQTCNQQ